MYLEHNLAFLNLLFFVSFFCLNCTCIRTLNILGILPWKKSFLKNIPKLMNFFVWKPQWPFKASAVKAGRSWALSKWPPFLPPGPCSVLCYKRVSLPAGGLICQWVLYSMLLGKSYRISKAAQNHSSRIPTACSRNEVFFEVYISLLVIRMYIEKLYITICNSVRYLSMSSDKS